MSVLEAPWRRNGYGIKPYLIAEIGVNHGGDLETAKAYVREAGRVGFDAVKFQSYRAARLAAADSPAYWDLSEEPTTSQRDLFAKYDGLVPDDYRELAAVADQVGVAFSTTPFDLQYVDELASLVSFFKVASADITNVPLLRRVASSGHPVVLSTGGSTYEEIGRALDVLTVAGASEIAILHCVLNYPTAPEHASLRQIEVLTSLWPAITVGYSDHVPPQDDVPFALEHVVVAALLGARIIEKHFTLDRSLPGNDHYHAADPSTMLVLQDAFARIDALRGPDGPKDLTTERNARMFARRGLYAARAIKAGSTLKEDDVIALRPAHAAISASQFDATVGRSVTVNLAEGEPLTAEVLT